jgi:hypothetical protein
MEELICENESIDAINEATLTKEAELLILEAQHLKKMAAEESLHKAELQKMIAEAKEKELKLHNERERLAKEQHEKDKKNYDHEMETIKSSIEDAQSLAV